MQLKSVVEFYETQLGESIDARNEAIQAFHDLGPPDLVHLTKREKVKKDQKPDVGSFHFATGIDCSSSATIAAYLNSLSYLMTESAQSWFGGGKVQVTYTIRSGTFCVWNAFSRIDVRVEVRIPGGVEACGFDGVHDFKIALTPEMWLETYVSAILRALVVDRGSVLYPSSTQPHQTQSAAFYNSILMQLGIRTVNPFPGLDDEKRFLDAALLLFRQGWRLGSDIENQIPNLVNNHMAKILAHYFTSNRRYQVAIEFFSELVKADPEIGALISTYLIGTKQEEAAVKLLHRCTVEIPLQSSALLKAQGEFLWHEKKRLDLALELFKFAVDIAPSDADGWLQLAELYAESKEIQLCLLTLNSCPMFLPVQGNSLVLTQDQSKNLAFGAIYSNFVDLLRRIPAPARRNYPINEEAVVPPEVMEDIQSAQTAAEGNTNAATAQQLLQDPITFFAGYVGHKDACDMSLYKLQAPMLKGTLARAYSLLAKLALAVGWDDLLNARSRTFVMEEEYKQVKKTTDGVEEIKAADGGESPASKPWRGSSHITVSMFDSKRLCERWLDHLFMILYEDLRAYTIFKAEFQQRRSEKKPYLRTPLEWELLGDLCLRVHHPEDAKECFQFFVEKRFSFRIWHKLLQLYVAEGKPHLILGACEKMISALDRWKWGELAHPASPIAQSFSSMLTGLGHGKVRSLITSMKLPKRNEIVMLKILDWVVKMHPLK